MNSHVPEFLRTQPPQPAASSLLVVDERVPLAPLIKALGDGGFTIINDRTGKLVVTYWPEDFRTDDVRDGVPTISLTCSERG